MAYKFIDVIADIEARLDQEAEAVKNELQAIDSRQTELKSELAELEPRHLRVQALKSRSDDICPACFITHGDESPVRPISSPDGQDHFRCGKCDAIWVYDPRK